mgnify:CR=1 FL=1
MGAERFFPGDPGVRAVFEITGATPLSYLTMFPYFVVAKDSLKQGAEAMQGAMSVEEQQERVGQALINFMQEMGDDPQNFINAIEAGSFRRIVDDTLEAHDAAYGDLSVDQIADLPTTTRMLASLDSNDLSENASLDLLEAAILRKVPLEAQKFSNQYREQSKRIQKLIDATHELPIKEFDLYTSNESYGPHAEYIRDGLIYPEWRNHMVAFLEGVNQKIFRSLTVMMTINSLCLFSITEFLDDMIILKRKYGPNRPNVDFNILRWPAFMSPLALPDDVKMFLHDKLKSWFEERKQDSDFYQLFTEGEIAQIERLIDYIEVVKTGHVTTEDENDTHFHDFKSFYEQYDKRRGKDFCKTFPELAVWYKQIKVDDTIPDVPIKPGEITHFEDGEYKPE